MASPFLKPILVNGDYYTFELIKINKSVAKSFEDAKASVLPIYIENQKKEKLIALAKKSVDTFNGKETPFITVIDTAKLTELQTDSANDFLIKLFATNMKRGYISLKNGNIVMYNILEQKMLTSTNTNPDNPIVRLKSAMFNEGLIKKLQNKYKTEIFIQGL